MAKRSFKAIKPAPISMSKNVIVLIAIVAVLVILVIVFSSNSKTADSTDGSSEVMEALQLQNLVGRAGSSSACTDDDGSFGFPASYYTSGEDLVTTGLVSGSSGAPQTGRDFCSNALSKKWDDKFLFEFFCNNAGYIAVNSYNCPNGCSANACVCDATNAKATDDCPAGYVCDDGSCICQSGDCKVEIVCTDSDANKAHIQGRNNYYFRGFVTEPSGEVTSDVCTDEIVNGNKVNLWEFYCADQTSKAAKSYNCPYGCLNGACLSFAEDFQKFPVQENLNNNQLKSTGWQWNGGYSTGIGDISVKNPAADNPDNNKY